MSKSNYVLKCDDCDSQYEIYVRQVDFFMHPDYCPFCGAEIDAEDEEEDEDPWQEE